ncbi:hypothetical protein N658DRAFT_484972 [Parathielavia hyrcaniae]|uniref:Uncharacterized protein n=1 Tax=Parathielavia hyrcaniae TaxID=113614 RepID=A0AAN6Q8K5_9PEZI|nr:hypothetical protein N658DRAFT_484972 [Parathielavia hyrcaniae]
MEFHTLVLFFRPRQDPKDLACTAHARRTVAGAVTHFSYPSKAPFLVLRLRVVQDHKRAATMRGPSIFGYMTSATALLGCVPGAVSYRNHLWASFRQSILDKATSVEEDDRRVSYQNIEPREQQSDPPYGWRPPPFTDVTSSSSSPSSLESSTSAWDGEIIRPLSEHHLLKHIFLILGWLWDLAFHGLRHLIFSKRQHFVQCGLCNHQ